MSEKPDSENDFSNTVSLKPGLYIVATPIGNLRDITLRALEVLRSVDLILCEDTRTSRKLLSAHGIGTRTKSYHDHSDDGIRAQIVGMLGEGKKIALISDAGMPLINDPGYKLVQSCMRDNIYVTSLPGANAPLAALQLSGLPSDKFSFLGFFPNKTKARQVLLKEWVNIPSTLMAFETAPRLEDALADIHMVMGDRPVAVVREITKMFEEVRRGSAAELLDFYRKNGRPKGEIVIVIGPPVPVDIEDEDLAEHLRKALKTMKTKEAAAHVAQLTGASKSALYATALEIARNE